LLFFLIPKTKRQRINLQRINTTQIYPLIYQLKAAGISTILNIKQNNISVAGLRRASPSTTLDKTSDYLI
jgi:hypothetical protein